MSQEIILPKYAHPVAEQEHFNFACHKGVSCFTECCRMLELPLTPYDVLRLRKGTEKSSRQLLDNYIIEEQDPTEPFPRFYLTMIDDGRASCVFVSSAGCEVYDHRPSACRAYPIGRGAIRLEEGNTIEEHFVLIKEEHCQGFNEPAPHTVSSYTKDQELLPYNQSNDLVSTILQHESIRKGFIPSKKQIEQFTLALYDVDTFREKIENDLLPSITGDEKKKLHQASDETLLHFAVDWISRELFCSTSVLTR
ncbi:MAG: YkgJ family cysteine cluster protein [Desulfobulbaceae bacterium]|nr:YkgJ family cysteine cluster protein [Desulfobulbaceae bacterium]